VPTVGYVWILGLVLSLAAPSPAWAADEDPVLLFREGMEAYRAGRCEEATTKLESALAVDPDLHSARLPLAECYYKIGIIPGAINHLKVYITELEPGPERARAEERLRYFQKELAAMAGVAPPDEPDEGSADGGGAAEGGDGGATGPSQADAGTHVMIDVSGGGSHVATVYQPTFGVVAGGLRIYPFRYLGIGLTGGIGLGGGPGATGLVRLPEARVTVGFVFPVRPALILMGAELLLVGSRLHDRHVVDPGVVFVGEIRGPLGSSPLYLGGAVQVGYLLAPTVGGRLVLGVRLGPGKAAP